MACQAVGDGDQDVLHAARLEVVEDLHPEFGPFRVLDPQAENVLGFAGFGKLRIRLERRLDVHKALLTLAAAVICTRSVDDSC
jgi:hypothetical protein